MLNRRRFLASLVVPFASRAAVPAAGWPRLVLAAPGAESRFVLVILRGGLDGLAAVPPTGDPGYQAARGELALDPSELAALDADFSLHPAMVKFREMFRNGEAAVIHAAASPYRDRSHFDGQDVLETGTPTPTGRRDGWLARALAYLPAGNDETAVALAREMPLVLAGSPRATSWAPAATPPAAEGLLAGLADLYAGDRLLSDALRRAQAATEMAGAGDGGAGPRRGGAYLQGLARAAGNFLSAPAGPRIAVLEIGGWDTHAAQGQLNGRLANRLGGLDEVLASLRENLAAVWDRTVVMVVTEFGRTVHANGTGGTDHGTGGVALLLGGAVAGRRVYADWPGLGRAELLDGRDLRPTTDLRAAFKAVLITHLGIREAAIETDVFPGSREVAPLDEAVVAA